MRVGFFISAPKNWALWKNPDAKFYWAFWKFILCIYCAPYKVAESFHLYPNIWTI
jgi:hypothetical protein